MSAASCNCREQVIKLNQQVSIMRKEIKNLRQTLDGAVRAHRKHLSSLQLVLSNIGQAGFKPSQMTSQKEETTANGLEQGTIRTVPIGHISSCFSVKNGTPRQPTVCARSKATLTIRRAVFSNPAHSLVGLDLYSHVWVIFLFHKNGHLSCKAKVKPPRLEGQRVGVFSTRSPHRPNALGLTLARLDRVSGDTLHLSEIDMIAGTPVLDVKPYISDYDSTHSRHSYSHCPNDSLQSPNDSLQSPNDSPLSLNDSPQRLNDSPQRLNDSPQRLNDSPQRLNDSPQRLNDSPQRLNDSPQSLNDSTLRLNDSTLRLNDSPQRLNDSPHSRDQVADAATMMTGTGSVVASVVSASNCPSSSLVHDMNSDGTGSGQDPDPWTSLSKDQSKVHILSEADPSSYSAARINQSVSGTFPEDLNAVLGDLKAFVSQEDASLSQRTSVGKLQASDGPTARPLEAVEAGTAGPCYGEEAYSTIAGWIREPPVANLEVRFTPHAEKELRQFLPPEAAGAPGMESGPPPGCEGPRFRFLTGPEEATEAIRGVLSADPRSVYRRTRCKDRLFFFTLDTADITCWFGPGFAEVVHVRPVPPS